jgi:hypothetical protein
MPDEFERHGRSSESAWGPYPSRSQARRQAAQIGEGAGRKPKNMKTPKKECTRSADGLHHGEPRMKQPYGKKDAPPPDLTCRWMGHYYVRSGEELAWWNCNHMEYCKDCGNKMNDSMGKRCPSYPGDPEQRARAEQHTRDLQREREARAIPEWKRRKIPNGPQGYRKPRDGS